MALDDFKQGIRWQQVKRENCGRAKLGIVIAFCQFASA